MRPRSRPTWSFIMSCALILLPFLVQAQGRFTVNGRLKIEGGDLDGARAVVFKDGVKERTLTSGLGKFSLDLELNRNYVVSFEKDGYVSKKISFNTNAPSEAIMAGFTPFDYAVSLFKQYDDINIVVFNQPVGVIRYDQKIGDFDYDTDYTKSIQSQLEQVLEQVEQKQKDEKGQEKKRQAEEAAAEKARAKQEAEEAKRAAAEEKAAAEAQAKREAEKVEQEKQREIVEVKADKEPEPVAPPVVDKPMIKPSPVVRNSVLPEPISGETGRRSIEPVVGEEPSRVAMAKTNLKQETPSLPESPFPVVERSEELEVEATRVTTVVKLSVGDRQDEYRKVIHKWGGCFYFKNGATCTKEVYEQEARGEDLAGATPRGKLD